MLTLQKRSDILFEGTDHFGGFITPIGETPFDMVENRIREIIENSSVLDSDLEIYGETLSLTEVQKDLGISKKIDLLQVNRPIKITATLTPLRSGSNYELRVKLVLTEKMRWGCYLEHPILEMVVESLSEGIIGKNIKILLDEIPYQAAVLITSN